MTIYDCRWRHGPDGRIAEKTEIVNGNPMTWTYAYDKEGRLTDAQLDGRTVCDINYDREGRRVGDYLPHLDTHCRNYAYSGMDDRLQQTGNNGYTHDENGFRSIWNSGGKYTLYEYAPDYRLMKAEKRETGEAFKFTHDEEGRREARYSNGELVEACRWLGFLRLDSFHDGELAYRFAYRDGERTPHAMEREDGAEAYLFYDQVGSLRAVADAGGNVIKDALYDRLRWDHGGLQSGLAHPHRLCGRSARPGPGLRSVRVKRLRHVHQPLDRARSARGRGRRPRLLLQK